MVKVFSKKIIVIALLLSAAVVYGQKDYSVSFSQPREDIYQLNFDITHWDVQTVSFDGVQYQQLIFSSSTTTQEKGWAELPFVSASVQLPAQKNVDMDVIYTDYTDYQLNFPLVPSRGVIYRNQDPATIPYQIDPESVMDRFYPGNLAFADEPYIIRDVRGTSVRVFPFQYNAATNTLRIYTQIEVLLTENNEPATNPLLKENPTPVKEMIGAYKSLFLNFDASRYTLPMAQYGEILVITTPRDEETINSYIQWKQEKGFIVHKEVVPTGTNVKSLIQQKYDANNNILYIQLVGGWNDIKSDLGGGENAPLDPKMGCVVGTDNFPDISIGRFSCSDATELVTQINKAIDYEKTPNMDPTWHESFIGIASNQGPGDDGEIDYVHVTKIYTQRLQVPLFTYTVHNQNYEPNANKTILTGHINSGASTIAYCGHGDWNMFVTTGFNNNDVDALVNGDKLPFIVSVACVNGSFHNHGGGCFAEKWLKKQNGGAVVTWMSSINQPWNPPMRGQDYFYDILTGGYNYSQHSGENGITTTEQRTTWGAIVVNAANLMLTEAQAGEDINTAHTWTTFGDASLQLRTKQPVVLASSMPTIIVGTNYETTITADGNPVEDALVCISQNGTYYSTFTDEDGFVSIANDFLPGDVLLVVTAFNTTTIYETIDCIPANGAFVIYNSYSVVGADKLTYISENEEIEVTVKNVGSDPTSGTLNVSIACDDPLLAIVNATAQITSPIPAGGSAVAIFKVTVNHSIPDNKS
ncbi:MAG: C25 family cysteine peptidase, partial [Bacteroidales bacterium]|nr:C25 family cysteine peptidase [Bacteroidales bacterium]